MTLRLPMPAETLPGMAADSAFITVSASWLPGQKRAMVGAGKVGLARQPLGATMVIGRIRPALTGMWPWISRVEQHRADGEPDRDVGGAFERHVDRPVGHLRRGAGEVDHEASRPSW